MTETTIESADDLINFIEADAVCMPGVGLCDIDLVTGAVRIQMSNGRRFAVTAVEVTYDD